MPFSGDETGLVFNIQKFSLHDGHGIRTLVFLKGCPLRCIWCSNPEGQSFIPEIAYDPLKCIGVVDCGRCIETCNKKAIETGEDGKVKIDRAICTECSDCTVECPPKALVIFGRLMTVYEVLNKVEEDTVFYTRSNGGITIGGGEPLSQWRFTAKLLSEARCRGIDTALETSGFGDWKGLEQICRHLNHIFYDIKLMDPERHKQYTGVSNQLILDNLLSVCERFPELEVTVRTPIVPGVTDSPEDISDIVDFLNEIPRKVAYELLPYHGLGGPKYRFLGREYILNEARLLDQHVLSILRQSVTNTLKHPLICRI
jgi:pyruvate formate lyase activating enzyme